ncbi:MAG TPA: D-arabinono-1,4-lactone oxidase, partial [Solirubrobacteraceae bacterium]|nr:D-arabinono-1,4-lactone oxidase [Solirubrobacteraceae bacterium]
LAWVDLMARGSALGRSVVTRAEEAPAEEGRPGVGPARGGSAHGVPGSPFRAHPRVSVPSWFPAGALRPGTVGAFNELYWRRTPRRRRGERLGLASHLFPLDAIGGWNRLYGPGGLVQYQFVVPIGEEETLIAAVRRLRERGLPMYLAVLKRLGAGSGGLLSFPIAGWTLAIDLPADAPGLRATLAELDVMVAGAGGRVYLAKDACLRAETFREMYPKLDRFQAVRERVDPGGVLRSDLGARLGLCRRDAR